MSSPQAPEERRSGKSAATPLEQAKSKAGMDRKVGPGGAEHEHGTDKGRKGGGEGGGVPPDQRPDHP
ncbi:hypothetical protein [Streptomyces apocyni]|uniref:hypothetical protein n=1 Tax=Streptomyces apocyni TaxID=2654677 RepID=UPI0012EA39DD|nr:hypothetical protein [Streptomyces apocyni]